MNIENIYAVGTLIWGNCYYDPAFNTIDIPIEKGYKVLTSRKVGNKNLRLKNVTEIANGYLARYYYEEVEKTQ